jgi:aconitate hydratase
MGVLPLQFQPGTDRRSLKLTGEETFDISGIEDLSPRDHVTLSIHRKDGTSEDVELLVRIDTLDEMDYYRNGGILHYVLRQLAA